MREEAGAGKQKDHNCFCRKPLMLPILRGAYEQAKTPLRSPLEGQGLLPCVSEAEATTISSHATPPASAGWLLISQGWQRAAGTWT